MALAKRLENFNNKKELFDSNISIISYIEAYLRARKKFRPFRMYLERNKVVGFHPSSIGSACGREMVFSYLDEKKYLANISVTESLFDDTDNYPKLERVFDTGHVIHNLVYSYLYGYKETVGDLDFLVEQPIKKIYNKFLISGTGDIIIKLQDGNRYLIDVKTINTNSFSRLNYDTISKQYIAQINIYAFGLGLDKMGILFWNKNNGELKEFFFHRDDKILFPILKKALKAKMWIEGRIDNVPILDECKKGIGRYEHCKYSLACFSCKSKKDLLNLTIKKNHKELI